MHLIIFKLYEDINVPFGEGLRRGPVVKNLVLMW